MKDTSPDISVIVPVYNMSRYLPQCMESLQSQTLKNIEFICIDDGSTDDSFECLQKYAELDTRIKITRKSNSGYGHTMNLGLAQAAGRYVGIVEPDDFVSPETFETLGKLAEENGFPDIVKANYYTYSDVEGEVFVENYKKEMCAHVISPLGSEALDIFLSNPTIWAGIYRRDFLSENNVAFLETPGASFQDTGFAYKAFIAADSLYFFHGGFLRYRIDNAMSSVKSNSKVFCVCDEMKSIEEFLLQYPYRRERLCGVIEKRKYCTYRWNYRRLGWDARSEFVEAASSEFQEDFDKGWFDKKLFSRKEWKTLLALTQDPKAWYCREKASEVDVVNPKVSVILAVYNVESYLKKSLTSLVEQTLYDIEIICIDDGSTDGSLEILKEFGERDKRIKILHQENSGAGAARNVGISHARGEYLSILDGDDFFERTMLERAYNRAKKHDADIVVFRSDQFNNATGEFRPLTHTIRTQLLPKREPFSGLEIEEDAFNAFMGWAWDKLFKRSFVEANELRFQEIRTTNDMLFVFSSIVIAKRIVTMSDCLAHYRRGVGGLSETREKSWDCFYLALLALREQLQKQGLFERFQRDYENYCVQLSVWHTGTVSESTRMRMLDSLRNGWFAELGVVGHPQDYFYNKDMYEQHLMIMDGASSQEPMEQKKTSVSRRRSVTKERKRRTRRLAAVYAKEGMRGVIRRIRSRI